MVELDALGSRDYVKETWRKLREGPLADDALMGRVDGLVHEIRDSGALRRNEERWPESNSEADYVLFKRMALYIFQFMSVLHPCHHSRSAADSRSAAAVYSYPSPKYSSRFPSK